MLREAERAVAVVRQLAARALPEVFALQLEVRARGVAVGRIFPDEVGDRRPASCRANDVCAMLPAVSGSLPTRSAARVSRYDRPARQLELAPTSPPACTKALHAPAPLLLRGLPGKASPLPISAPNSTNVSVGATHLSCTPSCANWPPRNAWYGERRVLEIPRVLVLLVHVADAGEEAAELRHEPVRQRGDDAVGFLDLDRVVRRQRDGEVAGEQMIDAGEEIDFRSRPRPKPRRPGPTSSPIWTLLNA